MSPYFVLPRCRKLPSALKVWTLYSELEAVLTTMVAKMPVLQMLRNPAMKARHWAAIGRITERPNIDPEHSDLSTKAIIDLPIGPGDGSMKDDIEEVCVGAAREKEIETKLIRVANDWFGQEFVLASFKSRGNLLLKGDRVSEVQGLLEDSLMTLTSLSNNR